MNLSIDNLAVSHGRRRVLDGVSAVFCPGRIMVILGPGGAGKSTLLHALAGRMDADAGQVRLGGRLIGRLGRRERARRIAHLADNAADRVLRRLSGSERLRARLARALAVGPQWLLLDEPFAALDPAQQLALIDQLRALAEQGVGVVLALGDPVQAARAADEALLLCGGKAIAFGPAREVLAHQPLREAFGIEVMVIGDSHGRLLPVPIGTAG